MPYIIGSTDNDFGASGDEPRVLHEAAKAFAARLNDRGIGPVYVYYFKRKLPGDGAGAFHSSDLWYMFGTLGKCWRPMTRGDWALSRRMLDAWAAFIKTGSPRASETPWLPYSEGEYVQEFDVN